MKSKLLFIVLLCLALIAVSSPAMAQFKKLKDKVKEKAEKKVEKKIEGEEETAMRARHNRTMKINFDFMELSFLH